MKLLPLHTVCNLPVIDWKSTLNFTFAPNSIVISSTTAKNVFESYSKSSLHNCLYVKGASEHDISELVRYPIAKHSRIAYLIGGGQVMDVGRLLAHHWNLSVICIPTLISTDAFLVDCTGIRKSGCVRYLQSRKAQKVIIDYQLLSQLTNQLFSVGCGDVLSIYTGVFDWQYAQAQDKLASDEPFREDIAQVAQSILKGLISMKAEIKNKSLSGLRSIVDALALEVQLCNLYGNSRPEEGGEHFFTYCIESKMPHFLHGEMVTFGVLITSYLQKQDISPIKDFADCIGLQYKPKGLTRQMVISTLKELPAYVHKHKLRFSIYNTFSYPQSAKQLDSFFNQIELN